MAQKYSINSVEYGDSYQSGLVQRATNVRHIVSLAEEANEEQPGKRICSDKAGLALSLANFQHRQRSSCKEWGSLLKEGFTRVANSEVQASDREFQTAHVKQAYKSDKRPDRSTVAGAPYMWL